MLNAYLQDVHTVDKCLLIPAAAKRRYNNLFSAAAGVDDLVVPDADADMVDIAVSTAGETNKISWLEL